MQIISTKIFLGLLVSASMAQTVAVIPLSSEPHHHLALHNDYVNVYKVDVAPHDSVVMHRHDYDAISVMLTDAQVTVTSPGKPDSHNSLVAGQIRLQARGYVHSTTIENGQYHNVTVELLQPQAGASNLCAVVIPGQPKHCANPPQQSGSAYTTQPEFESDETSVNLLTLAPHRGEIIASLPYAELLVALDSGIKVKGSRSTPPKSLKPGDFTWIGSGEMPPSIENETGNEVRLVAFTFSSIPKN